MPRYRTTYGHVRAKQSWIEAICDAAYQHVCEHVPESGTLHRRHWPLTRYPARVLWRSRTREACCAAKVSWGTWFFIALPVCIISILLIWVLLLVTFRPGRNVFVEDTRAEEEDERDYGDDAHVAEDVLKLVAGAPEDSPSASSPFYLFGFCCW
jgi:hypothetical protein